MEIKHLKTNRITNPLGFAFDQPSLSWIVDKTGDKKQTAARLLVAGDPGFKNILFDSGRVAGNTIDSLGYRPGIKLLPRTRYYWKVTVWGETEQAASETAWFETSKMDEPWLAQWITPDFPDSQTHPVFFKDFNLPAPVQSARLYICGLGLYYCELNGTQVGEEYLTPYCNAYDQWLQYQTYDITSQVNKGDNRITVMLGNGWYKGKYGLQDGPAQTQTYGDQFALIAELYITLESGEQRVLVTDGNWQAAPAPVLDSSIYDGETFDARIVDARIAEPGCLPENVAGVKPISLDRHKLEARRSLPVRIKEELKPAAVLHTPAGETVLDMGQNMVGWVRFKTRAAAGTKITLQFGEVLKNGNFYRENLRTAKAEYIYIANGSETVVQPFFTFYGFRYVKVTGWEGELDPDDFTGCVVYSDLDITGKIETSDPKVNQLFKNALWSQKGNFLDIPTDCPQRDERLGWTGDTQMFSGTACFNMDSAAFFSKFGYDMGKEQAKYGGMVPFVIPNAHTKGGGSSAWGDAATIVPWNVYEMYGDPAILEQQFESMRAWVDYIQAVDDASGSKRLWTTGFHYGDWLSLDGNNTNSPFGGTPEDFIASAYYYHSTRLVARAAAVLRKDEEAARYAQLASDVKAAIQKEYFTPNGRLAINTQTGYVLVLFLDLAPDQFRSRIIDDLVTRLRRDKVHLRTGFVGTPYLCRVLSNNDANDLAYRLLLNEDYPSWLYAVNLGATTIWERWNSLNPDGSLSDSGMNSFNHYAYGSIVEWMYRDMCGLNPSSGDDLVTGFRRARIAPKPDKSLLWAKSSYLSSAGMYESGWHIGEKGSLLFEFSIPFNAQAQVVLPDARINEIFINGHRSGDGIQQDNNLTLHLDAGSYTIEYQPTRAYLKSYSTHTPIVQTIQNTRAKELLAGILPVLAALDDAMLAAIGNASLREIANTSYLPMTPDLLDEIDKALSGILTD